MSRGRFAGALALGLVLASLPFAQYVRLGGEAHVDHAPRHGGQLGMVGAYHVELARRRGMVEAFVSDAWRRPVRPRQGWVAFDGGAPELLSWDSYRLVGRDVTAGRVIEATVVLADGTRLAVSFDFSE
jgi:hypothetical protein